MGELLSLIGGPKLDVDALTEEQLEELMHKTKKSVAQIDLRTDPPSAIFKSYKIPTIKQINDIKDPKVEYALRSFILVITDSGPALLLRDPSTKELPVFEDLPKQAQKYFILSERKVAGAFLRRRLGKKHLSY